jgi:hypothetical protein
MTDAKKLPAEFGALDADRNAILQRRAAMIAATVASLGIACTSSKAQSATQVERQTAPTGEAPQSIVVPAVCLSIAIVNTQDAGMTADGGPRDGGPRDAGTQDAAVQSPLKLKPTTPRPCLYKPIE